MTVARPVDRILHHGILPIARGLPSDVLVRAASVLSDAGIDVIEVTMDSPGAARTIETLRQTSGLIVGAGTVRSVAQARQALDAGAQFLVTPHVDAVVAQEARRSEVPVILGAMTPTEIEAARAAGAELVKLFPASALGPDYLRQVLAPLSDARLVPTGGITADNAGAFIAAGAAAVGVGTALLGPRAADATWLRDQARALLAAVAGARQRGTSGHA